MISKPIIRALSNFGVSPKLSIFNFHNVCQEGDILEGISMPVAEFERQLKWINSNFTVMPLDKAIELTNSSSNHRLPAIASLTFDDGYLSHKTLVAPLLKRLGMHATFFVSSGYMKSQIVWSDLIFHFFNIFSGEELSDHIKAMNRIMKSEGLSYSLPEDYHSFEKRVKYSPLGVRHYILEYISSHTDVTKIHRQMMDEMEVRSLDSDGFSIGAHTVNHPILSEETNAVAKSEISDDIDFLSTVVGKPIELFAYPNGKVDKDFNGEHIKVLEDCGIKYALTTSPGCYVSNSSPYRIPRISIEGSSKFKLFHSVFSNFQSTALPIL